jgi:hypothetical protein
MVCNGIHLLTVVHELPTTNQGAVYLPLHELALAQVSCPVILVFCQEIEVLVCQEILASFLETVAFFLVILASCQGILAFFLVILTFFLGSVAFFRGTEAACLLPCKLLCINHLDLFYLLWQQF